MVEQDLDRLGYGPGPVDGEETMETTIAITKFQAASNMEITGEVKVGDGPRAFGNFISQGPRP